MFQNENKNCVLYINNIFIYLSLYILQEILALINENKIFCLPKKTFSNCLFSNFRIKDKLYKLQSKQIVYAL